MENNTEFHKCYNTLYDELLNGEVRNNDDARILAYECAVRKVYKELNTIFPHNAKVLNDSQIDSKEIQSISNAGLNVLFHDNAKYFEYETQETTVMDDTYLCMNNLDFDYPFLQPQGLDIYPEPINISESELERQAHEDSQVEYSKLNLAQKGSKKILSNIDKLGWTNDGSQDFKMFLKLFPDALEASSFQKKINNVQKIVNMFYVYDEVIFFNKTSKEIIELPNDSKMVNDKTLRNWVQVIQKAIDTYCDYYFPSRKN